MLALILSNILIKNIGEAGIILTYIIVMTVYYLIFTFIEKYETKNKIKEN